MHTHSSLQNLVVHFAIVTISDTRNAITDKNGLLMQELLQNDSHQVISYEIMPDEPELITNHVIQLGDRPDVSVIITNGGTGISPRDNTYDAICHLIEKPLPGFGEIFRLLSYQEIGPRAMASRAVGGIYKNKLLFALPGSTHGVKLGMEKLILPEIHHLVGQMQGLG
jgi:molybdenum cofactor biosynthesis protein B